MNAPAPLDAAKATAGIEGNAHPGGRSLIDDAALNSRHRLFVILIALAAFFDFFDLMLSGSVTAALLASGWSTFQLNAIFLSVTGLGGIASNLLAGALADRFGRRRVFRAALLLVGLSTLSAALAPSMPWLIAARFVASLGMAAIPGVGFTLIVELLPTSVRARWVGLTGLISQSAIFASALAAYLLLPAGGWRWMFVIPGLGCTLIFLLTAMLPESPRWLAAVGREDDARQALAKMGIAGTGPIISGDPSPASAHRQVEKLFSSALARRLVLGVVLATGFNVATTGFLTWLPTLLLERNFTIAHSLGYNLVMSLGIPLGALASTIVADRLGRKRGVIATAALALLLAAAFSLTGGVPLLVTGFFFQVAMGVLSTMIMGLYLPELYPTAVRARATAVSMATVRLVSVFLPFALLALLNSAGVGGVMALIGGGLLIIVAVTAALGIETAGKPLDQA